MNTKRRRPSALDVPRHRLTTPPAVTLWQPEVVVASIITAAPGRLAVTLPEPGMLGREIGAARSVLTTLAEARETLGAGAAARARAVEAGSTRERVTATIEAFRAEAALDDALSGTWRQVTALMEERGLR
jgi:hypothetical protein